MNSTVNPSTASTSHGTAGTPNTNNAARSTSNTATSSATPAGSSPLVDLRGITLSYPDGDQRITPLRDIDVKVQAGELLAITGESGSGKSSLLSIMAGLITPDSGEVRIAGEVMPQDEEGRTNFRRTHMGLVFQTPNLIPSLRVREQLELVEHISGRKADSARIDELLSQVGLEGLGNRRVQKLSGGQRQRVSIARALMAQPSIILADEPTSALDAELSEQIMETFISVTRAYGLATVLVTHDREQAARADREVFLKGGSLTEISHEGRAS